MIPEGTFKARCTDIGLVYNSTGGEQIEADLVLLEGPSAGSHILWRGFFTEKTTDRTFESLRLLGWQGDDLSDLSGCDANEIFAVVEHEDYENDQGETRTYAKVRWINAAGGVQLKDRLDHGAALAFAQKMKGAAMAQRQRAKGSPAPASRAGAAPPRTPPTGRQPAPGANSGNTGRRPPPRREEPPPPTDDDNPFIFNECEAGNEEGIGERWNRKRTVQSVI